MRVLKIFHVLRLLPALDSRFGLLVGVSLDTLPVIKHLDIFKDSGFSLLPGLEVRAMGHFIFKSAEEALQQPRGYRNLNRGYDEHL